MQKALAFEPQAPEGHQKLICSDSSLIWPTLSSFRMYSYNSTCCEIIDFIQLDNANTLREKWIVTKILSPLIKSICSAQRTHADSIFPYKFYLHSSALSYFTFYDLPNAALVPNN